ncbi:ABC transporter ATP-binding protein [Pontibacillus salicampi]|uniref:ABC transporter ATP-binding protein n=1 Tax=Pontibacillus salicampi TaxID=1449801 RepID=A0ABV6LMI2_9BACI
MSVVEVENLNIDIKRKKILQNVNVSFEKGKIYGLLGPNGAGKTTLLKAMLGVFRPNSGSISFKGQDIYQHSKRDLISSIGSIIEFPGFYDNLTLQENLTLHLKYLQKDTSSQHINRLLQTVGLYQFKEKRFSETSLGMKQRLGIARAMSHNPDLLLLDEPTNGLDPHGIKEVREMLIREVISSNKTVIISSHLLNEIDLMADELVFMNNGEIIFETTKMKDHTHIYLYRLRMPSSMTKTFPREDLLEECQGHEVYTGKDELEFVSPLSQKEIENLLEQHQVPTIMLEVFELTLEDLYLKLLEKGEENEVAYS